MRNLYKVQSNMFIWVKFEFEFSVQFSSDWFYSIHSVRFIVCLTVMFIIELQIVNWCQKNLQNLQNFKTCETCKMVNPIQIELFFTPISQEQV